MDGRQLHHLSKLMAGLDQQNAALRQSVAAASRVNADVLRQSLLKLDQQNAALRQSVAAASRVNTGVLRQSLLKLGQHALLAQTALRHDLAHSQAEVPLDSEPEYPEEQDKRPKIATALRGARTIFWLLPQQFLDEFGDSFLEDLVDVVNEHSGKTWWVVFASELLRLFFRFSLKRFQRRKKPTAEESRR